jgi:hypothetical protein
MSSNKNNLTVQVNWDVHHMLQEHGDSWGINYNDYSDTNDIPYHVLLKIFQHLDLPPVVEVPNNLAIRYFAIDDNPDLITDWLHEQYDYHPHEWFEINLQ